MGQRCRLLKEEKGFTFLAGFLTFLPGTELWDSESGTSSNFEDNLESGFPAFLFHNCGGTPDILKGNTVRNEGSGLYLSFANKLDCPVKRCFRRAAEVFLAMAVYSRDENLLVPYRGEINLSGIKLYPAQNDGALSFRPQQRILKCRL